MQQQQQRHAALRPCTHPSRVAARRFISVRAKASATDSSSHTKNVFVFGLGYTSVALANWLAKEGWSISGTCRSEARVAGLRAKGWHVEGYDPGRGSTLSPELSARLADSPYVLSSIPPVALALYDPALSAQKSLLRPLAAGGRLAWFGYLSSTGVYGDWQGEWVDESSPCRQTSSKAIVRQEAEAAWQQMCEQHGLPTHIFRLGGIYGPGRSVLDSLRSQPADLSASQERRGRQRYTARCHVYDICAVLKASMAAPRPGAVYNIVDDDPAPRGEVMEFARRLVAGDSGGGAAVAAAGPEAAVEAEAAGQSPSGSGHEAAAGGSEAAGSGEGDSSGGSGRRRDGSGAERLEEKRVRNGLIRQELGVVLRYPTYREGVAALHGGDCWPLTPEDLVLL